MLGPLITAKYSTFYNPQAMYTLKIKVPEKVSESYLLQKAS